VGSRGYSGDCWPFSLADMVVEITSSKRHRKGKNMTTIKFTVGKTLTGFDAYYETNGIIVAVTTGDTIAELKANALESYNGYAEESGKKAVSLDQITWQLDKSTETRTYTEAEILKAMEYACEYQKALDYQAAGKLLMVESNQLTDNSILLLDELSNNKTAISEINLGDIFN
jgi:hypothetical protein